MRKARDILDSENKMLNQLVTAINAFAKDYDDEFERQNLECWGKELSGYRGVNETYQGMTDDALRAALTEEIEILNQCLDSIKSDSDAANYWKQNLRENIWYTDQTRKRI